MIKPLSIVLLSFSLLPYGGNAQKKLASPPAEAMGTIDGVRITIDYHQPSVRGRRIMGDLVPYDNVWRTGANNTTMISFSDDVSIEGKPVPKGKYGMYTVPGTEEWVIILNKTMNWGAYEYKKSDDLLRVNVKPTKTKQFVETFTIDVESDRISLEWENTRVAFTITKGR